MVLKACILMMKVRVSSLFIESETNHADGDDGWSAKYFNHDPGMHTSSSSQIDPEYHISHCARESKTDDPN